MSHPDTCLTFERDGRTIEVDDLSRSGGMDDTYAVYENDVMLGDFMTTWLGVPVGLTLEEMAWGVVLDQERLDAGNE